MTTPALSSGGGSSSSSSSSSSNSSSIFDNDEITTPLLDVQPTGTLITEKMAVPCAAASSSSSTIETNNATTQLLVVEPSNAVETSTETTTGVLSTRQGHSFCGCCCDMRFAVIAMNTTSICLTIGGALFVLAGLIFPSVHYRLFPSDAAAVVYGLVGAAVLLCCFSAGIRGAKNYEIWQLVVALVIYVSCAVGGLAMLNLQSLVVLVYAALAIYAHSVLIMEMRNGVMDAETYPSVEQQRLVFV